MSELSNELRVVRSLNPGTSCAHSELLMARLRTGGVFELLSFAAWARALGYPLEELSGKYLCELIPLETDAASAVVAELVDPQADAPIDVPLRCKDRRRKNFRFYRRFDERAETLFVIADELG